MTRNLRIRRVINFSNVYLSVSAVVASSSFCQCARKPNAASRRRNRHVARVELEMSWMINTLVILMMVRSLEPWCDSSRFWKEHPNYPSFRHSLKQVLYFLHSRFSVDNWHLCFFSITCGSGQSAAEILQSRKSNSTVCNGRRSQTRDSERKLLSMKDEMKESCQGALGVKLDWNLGYEQRFNERVILTSQHRRNTAVLVLLAFYSSRSIAILSTLSSSIFELVEVCTRTRVIYHSLWLISLTQSQSIPSIPMEVRTMPGPVIVGGST